MTDKSRESFEAWYQADIPNWTLRFNRENNSKGTYSFAGMRKHGRHGKRVEPH